MPLGGVLGNVRVGYSISSPLSFVKIQQIRELTYPQLVADRLEITTHGVTGLKRFMPGLADVTDTMIKVLSDRDPATSPEQKYLRDASISKILLYWRIEVAVDRDLLTTLWESAEFQGTVGTFAPATPVGGVAETDITVQFGGTYLQFADPAASQLS